MYIHFAQITAYDPTNTSMTSNATVQVLVRDDNDNTPEFVQESYHFVTEEETLPSNVVTLGTVRAEDIDRVDIGKFVSNFSLFNFRAKGSVINLCNSIVLIHTL